MKKKFENNVEYLDSLISKVLEDVEEDLKETTENVDLYKEKLTNQPTGVDQFGTLHNDSLRIKGLARERQLKLLLMIKDRVEKTNQANNNNNSQGNGSPEQMMQAAEEAAKSLREEMRNKRKNKGADENLSDESDETKEE